MLLQLTILTTPIMSGVLSQGTSLLCCIHEDFVVVVVLKGLTELCSMQRHGSRLLLLAARHVLEPPTFLGAALAHAAWQGESHD
jgi:hypothetical protein